MCVKYSKYVTQNSIVLAYVAAGDIQSSYLNMFKKINKIN